MTPRCPRSTGTCYPAAGTAHWPRTSPRRPSSRRSPRPASSLVHAAVGESDDPWDVEIDAVAAHQVLDALGPHHRAALTLRYLDGLPVAQVAEHLGRTVHATEVLLVRARAAFRVVYRAADPDPAFAAELRSRLEGALLSPEGTPMTTAVETQHTLGSYLAVNDARSALDFYESAFGARRRGELIVMEDGRIGHAELTIGDSVLMLADEFGEIGLLSPRTRGGPSQSLYLRVGAPDAVDATVLDAVEAGARLERAAADYGYGRNAVVVDPSGHRWMIASSPTETPTSRHGDLAYLTHAVADTARARAFYGAVLGWTFRPGRVADGWQIEGTSPPAGMHGGRGEPRDRAGLPGRRPGRRPHRRSRPRRPGRRNTTAALWPPRRVHRRPGRPLPAPAALVPTHRSTVPELQGSV